ncbi:hypothetical protein [Acinetobacter sp. ANC 4641]|uniref:hypothetical protein n=1 Tax=Acinetobacter sp. ANC 4641 TaxID=2529847 RepID=UPI0013F14BB6|nr:hypothetical protein [Acinetobacter sp. ANC 4641]
MRNRKLDQVCAKRLQAQDFAQEPPQYRPTSKIEIVMITFLSLVIIVSVLIAAYKALV